MSGSITHWIDAYRKGDRDAALDLWARYHQQLISRTRSNLQGAARRVSDEEDVALSAFASFCSGLEAGRFPNLFDRNDLWRLLINIAARKAVDHHRHERRKKRWLPNVATEAELDEVIGSEPTPDFCAQAAETLTNLLVGLSNDLLRQIAVWKMEGYTNEEISVRLDCSVSTVERKLRLIRHEWTRRST